MSVLHVLLVVLLAVTCTRAAIPCASCEDVKCVPPPPGCEVGRRVCSCCSECRLTEGEPCNAFSVECISELVCFTDQGVFTGKPPVESRAEGTCIQVSDIPNQHQNNHP